MPGQGRGRAIVFKTIASLGYWMLTNCFPLNLPIFQRIGGLQISESLSMFGQSISGQIDADNNGYIGKYKTYHIS